MGYACLGEGKRVSCVSLGAEDKAKVRVHHPRPRVCPERRREGRRVPRASKSRCKIVASFFVSRIERSRRGVPHSKQLEYPRKHSVVECGCECLRAS